MYINRTFDVRTIVSFGWKSSAALLVLSIAVYAAREIFHLSTVGIPFLPVSTIGTAVAFYLGFKTASSYDRLWEARKIWGEITNLSRSLASFLLAVTRNNVTEEVADIVTRQILFVNVLKAQLRKRMVWENTLYAVESKKKLPRRSFDEELDDALIACTCEIDKVIFSHASNSAAQIIHRQMRALQSLKENGLLDPNECSELVRICVDLLTQQGRAERIKNFPFPRQYAFFSELFVYIFVVLLPFGLIVEFEKMNPGITWLTIPFSVLIGWVFLTMEQIGDTSENPFENGVHDIPLSAICRQIEIELKQLLGQTDLPAVVQAENNVLM